MSQLVSRLLVKKILKHLSFHTTLPNLSNDKKISKHYTFVLGFSQDINYKLSFNENISKLLMNQIVFLSQFSVCSASPLSTIFQLEHNFT